MRTAHRRGCMPFTVSGTGSQAVFFDLWGGTGQSKYNANIRRIFLREAATGGATAVNLYLFHRGSRPTSSPGSVAKDYVCVEAAAVPLTASATAASLDTPITATPLCEQNCCMGFDVTAVGAWTLLGYVELGD